MSDHTPHDTDQPGALESTSPAPEGGDPEENPNRPREYHGARTVLVGVGVLIAVGAALFLALVNPAPSGDGGVVDLPEWLPPTDRTVGSTVGDLAPDFDLETAGGGRFRLSDWRGQPVLLNFWASWCAPCRREVPALIRAQQEHAETGFLVVGINLEESRSTALNFIGEFGMDYPAPLDADGAVFRAYGGGGPNGPPRSFFINPDGVITRIWAGQAPDAIVEEHTAEFAQAYDTGRSGQRPGLKSPPPVEFEDGEEALTVGAAVGDIAPDFLLAPVAGEAQWRLSEQRGASTLIILSPPGCLRCRDALNLADDAALTDGRIFVSTDIDGVEAVDLSDIQDIQRTAYEWTADVGRYFAPDGDLQLIVIDRRGLIVQRN